MKTVVKTKEPVKTKYQVKIDARGNRWMMCENSEPGGQYWKGNVCNIMVKVANDVHRALCWRCTALLVDVPAVRSFAPKSDKPKGWKFMKEFVSADGTVYHKGVEQPELKGTRPVTVIEAKPEKKRLSKQDKETAKNELGKEIAELKSKLFHETKKGKRAELTRALSKANRQFKKLM